MKTKIVNYSLAILWGSAGMVLTSRALNDFESDDKNIRIRSLFAGLGGIALLIGSYAFFKDAVNKN